MKNKIINGTPIFMIGLLLLIVFCVPSTMASELLNLSTQEPQTHSVSGIITDDNGDPLAGASVVVKGTTIGTITDAEGRYLLNVPANATLSASFIGYEPVLVEVNGRRDVHITLKSGVLVDEIVVTALGVKRDEKALGYAAQNVSGGALQTIKGVDMATSLTGRISGLVVKNSTEFNGQPTLEMRGENPLVVINGVPYGNMSLRDIPADDIESLSMLKGATAAALYGSRGSAGAVMVVTKSGGSKGLTIEINSNTMVTAGHLSMPKAQTSYARGQNGVIDTDYIWGPKLDIGNSAMQWNPKTHKEENLPLISSGKNNLKNFIETGVVTNNSISVMQSGDLGFFRVSANHIYNKGQFPNQKLNISNFSVAGRIKTKKFTLDAQMGYGRTTAPQMSGWGYNNQGYIYQIIMWTGADYDIRDYRDYWVTPNEKQNWLYDAWYDNPYMMAYEKLHSIDNNKLNASLNASYDFLPTLKLTFRAGYDYYKDEDVVRNPAGVNSVRGPTVERLGAKNGWGFSGKGGYGMNQNWGNSLNTDLMLNYNETFGKFDLDILAGGSIYYYQQREMGARTANGLAVPGWYSLANAVPSTTAGINSITSNYGKEHRQVNSIYGKISLSWNNAVFVDVTGRNDWSSTQPQKERSYFYPSVASSVVLTEFFRNPSWLGMWKVRASWTITKSPLGIYSNNVTYSTGSSWGGTSASAPTKLLADNLLPSQSRTWEFGTAAYFFGKRLHVDFAYFMKLFSNQQIDQTIAHSSGYKTALINTAETFSRRGFELTLSGYPVKNNNFQWHSMINLSSHHSYYVDIDPVYSTDNQWVKSGERKDYYALTEKALRDPNGNFIHASNGRIMLDKYNRLYGYKDPKFSFGFINSFTLKNWTMTVGIDGRIGGLLDNYIYGKTFDTGSAPETDNSHRYDEVVNGGKYVGKGVKIIGGSIEYDTQGNITSDTRQYAPNDIQTSYMTYIREFGNSWENRIRNASFFKLREVSVTYQFPKEWFKGSGISNLALSLTGQNLLMWTKDFKYSDPDRGKEDMNAPSQRMIGLNVKLGF